MSIAQDATPTNPKRFAVRARSLYLQACVAWSLGYIAGVNYPLCDYVSLTLLEARDRYPEARPWEFVALARRIRRLMDGDYDGAAYEAADEWEPLPDDPGAWVQVPQEQQRRMSDFGIGFEGGAR